MRASSGSFDDVELTSRAAGGDSEAFEYLFERWSDRAFDVAWHIVGDRDLALAITQDAFALAWREIAQLDPSQAFGSWLLCITRDIGLHRLQPATAPVGPDSDGPDKGRTNVMWLAAAALGAADASLLSLHLRHGVGPDELATRLGGGTKGTEQHLADLMDQLGRAVGSGVKQHTSAESQFASVPIVGAGTSALGRMVGELKASGVPAKTRSGIGQKPSGGVKAMPGGPAHGGSKLPWWSGRTVLLGAAGTVTAAAVAMGSLIYITTTPADSDKDGSGVEAVGDTSDDARGPSGGVKPTTTSSTGSTTTLPGSSTTASTAGNSTTTTRVTTPGGGGPPDTDPETTTTTEATTTTSTTTTTLQSATITSFGAERAGGEPCRLTWQSRIRFTWSTTGASSARIGPQGSNQPVTVPVNGERIECSGRQVTYVLSVTGADGKTITATTITP